MMMRKNMLAWLVAAGLSATSLATHAEVVVVVSAKNAATSLTADQAADIFLGKSSTLPGGGQAVPVDQAESSSVREEFYTKATGKTAAQVKAYWSKQIFSGKGQPPKDVGDNGGVKSQLASNPNAIGYIDKSAVDASVKALLTLK